MSAVASAQAKLLQQQQCSRVFALLDRSASGEALRECKRLLGGGPTQPAGAPAGAGAAPGETVELTAPRAAQAFPLAEALLAFAYMQAKQHVLALSTALRLKQEGWGSGDHQVAVPLASVLRHYHKFGQAAEVYERTFNQNKGNEALGTEVFDAFLAAGNFQRAQIFALELHRLFGPPKDTTGPKKALPSSGPKKPRGAVRKSASSGKSKKSDQYFWWSMTCYLLCNYKDSEMGKKLSLPLAEGMIRKHISLEAMLDPAVADSPAPFFVGTPAELEKFQVVLAVLTKAGKWDVAYQLLETPAGRAHAGLPSESLFNSAGKPTDAILLADGDDVLLPNVQAQAQAQQEAGILGNIDLRETRWETLRQLRKWPELAAELSWRFQHGDHDWSTLKTLIAASVEQGGSEATAVLALLEKKLATPTPLIGDSEPTSAVAAPEPQPEVSPESTSASSLAKKNKKKRSQANKKKNAMVKERGLFLARLELVRQWQTSSHALNTEQGSHVAHIDLRRLIEGYFDAFSSKPCAYEDLVPYLPLLSINEQAKLRDEYFAQHTAPDRRSKEEDERGLYTYMNALKLQSALKAYPSSDARPEVLQGTAADLLADAERYWTAYNRGLRAGKHLPLTEMQPADDLAYMAAEALVASWALSKTSERQEGQIELLLAASQVLGKALTASPKGYKMRLLLIRISLTLGAFSLAHTHYGLLNARAIQLDSMAHWLLERSAWFSLSDVVVHEPGQKTIGGPVQRALDETKGVYTENEKVTPSYLAKCFEFGNYSRAEELLDLYSAVESSLSRKLNQTEELLLHLSLGSDKTSLAQSAALILDTPAEVVAQHDQRDAQLLPSFLPLTAASAVESLRAGPCPDAGYARAFATAIAAATGAASSPCEHRDSSTLTAQEQKLTQLLGAPEADLVALRALVADLIEDARTSSTPLELLHLSNAAVWGYRGAQLKGATLEEEDRVELSKLADAVESRARQLLEGLAHAKSIQWLPDHSGPVVASSIAASRTALTQAASVLRAMV